MNVANDFKRIPNRGATVYKYGDPMSHGLSARITNDGILSFNIKAADGRESGTDMFASLMQRLKSDGATVRGIRGVWMPKTGSLNHDQYKANVSAKMTAPDAAANTWTGNIARRYGFTHIEVPQGRVIDMTVTPLFTSESL